ncbi:MAG: hypothetical protein PGN33_22835 [Methylobacterium radiotolerans]
MAHAANDDIGLVSVFSRFGLTEKKDIGPSSCKVKSDLDQRTFVRSIPALQEIGLLNKDITQTRINLQPKSMSMAFSVQMATVIIPDAFSDPKTSDVCYFTHTLTYSDEYGNDKTIDVFTYKFTRALNGRINWERFEAGNLAKIAPDFKFSREIMLGVRSEMQ